MRKKNGFFISTILFFVLLFLFSMPALADKSKDKTDLSLDVLARRTNLTVYANPEHGLRNGHAVLPVSEGRFGVSDTMPVGAPAPAECLPIRSE